MRDNHIGFECMYIINTTFAIHPGVFSGWKSFIKQVYIPLSLDELKFDDVKILRVHLDDENNELTYSVQLKSEHKEYIQFYQQEIQPRLLREMSNLFKEQVMHFSTLLEETQLDE